MTAVTRNALRASYLMLAFALVACGPTMMTKDSGTGGNTGDCVVDSDCPNSNFFFCNQVEGKCEVGCKTDDHCNNRGEYALTFCPTGQTKCLCDEFKCVSKRCSADSDCGDQVCRDGQCAAPPAASTVDSCTITPDVIVMRQGATAKFWVSAWAAGAKPVVIKDGATWSAVAGAPVTVMGAAMGNSATFSATATTMGTAAVDAVQASFGAKNCTAKVIVLPAMIATTDLAVAFTDELTGRPIAGAKVVISDNTTGDALVSGDTDERGYKSLTLPQGAAAPFTVTAFHPDYSWVTVARYTPSSGADARFLSLVSRRNQVDKYGGYKGTYTNVPETGNVHFGLTGMSIPGSITNLSISQLLGPTVKTNIRIGGSISADNVPIPAGAYLGFGSQKIRDSYSSQGLAGVCSDAAKTNAGTCGIRTAYSLSGDVSLSELPIDKFTSGLDNIKIPELLASIIPLFRKFNSSVIRDVEFSLKPTPRVNNEYVFTDVSSFTANQNHDFTQMPLSFAFGVKLPVLPQYGTEFADGALLLGGTNMPGRGVVPLGLGVGVDSNTPRNGLTDKQQKFTSEGVVSMRMAPSHHGLEGSDYGIVVLALSAKSISDQSSGVSASALFPRVPGNKLVFDPDNAAVDISMMTFPPFPVGTKANYATRSFQFAANPTGVGVVRVVYTDDLERRWEVLMDPTQATAGFKLPAVPTGMVGGAVLADRLFANNMSTGARSAYAVQMFTLKKEGGVPTGGTPISFTELVEFNSTNADRITNYLSTFSFLEKNVPTVSISKPSGGDDMATPAAAATGSNLELTVSGFKIGTSGDADGVVQLAFTSGGMPSAGCGGNAEGVAKVTMETTAGNGKLNYALPAACHGTVKVVASLVGVDQMTPLNPAVTSTKYITVP